jgi:hypothetical protein
VDHSASQEDVLFSLQAYYAKHGGVLLRKHCKVGASVVIQFFTHVFDKLKKKQK